MFNDKYGLTDAVLTGRKTMTRRIIRNLSDFDPRQEWILWGSDNKGKENIGIFRYETYKYSVYPQYQPGEVVAVAQSYKDLDYSLNGFATNPDRTCGISRGFAQKYIGWNNKMFVSAKFMPHQIRIIEIKLERLQDISEKDCLKEGLMKMFWGYCYEYHDRHGRSFKGSDRIRDVFADLIDGISGKGTWALNPFVFAYNFELIK